MTNINNYIDHTLLNPIATIEEIECLCEKAKDYDFKAVCVNPSYVSLASELLYQTPVLIASVIGFPLGANTTSTKVFEAEEAIKHGANEIDMVINLGLFKSKKHSYVEKDIVDVKKAIGDNCLKVIIETCYLNPEEITTISKIVVNSGADYIKTSTGFGTEGATLENIQLMKSVVNNHIKIKASGGIRDLKTALEYIDLGVSRIGTSSGVNIIDELNNN